MQVQADSGSSAVVKIQINVKGQQDRLVVKKSTAKGFEVVEVNGAVFYRKRKPVPEEQHAAPCAKRQAREGIEEDTSVQQQHAAGPADQRVGEDDAAAAHAADDEGPARMAGDAEHAGEPGAASHADPGASPMQQERQQQQQQHRFTVQREQRESTPDSGDALEALQEQLDKCLPPSCPKLIAVRFAMEKLLAHGAAQLDRGHAGGHGGGHGGGVGAVGAASYSQAAKQVLHGFTQLLQRQAEAAHGLLLQVRPARAAGQPASSSEDSGAAAAAPAPPATADGAAAEASAGLSPLERYLQQAPMVRELSHGGLLKAHLEQQLRALQEEEQAWVGLREKHVQREGATDAEAAAAVAADAPAAAALAPATTAARNESAGADAGGEPLLRRTEESVNAAVTVQVELLSSFMSKADALVSKGDQACMMLQADYHQEKFKTFPHVNSPAWLIKQITKQQALVTAEEPAAA